jgi:hypothetical protein
LILKYNFFPIWHGTFTSNDMIHLNFYSSQHFKNHIIHKMSMFLHLLFWKYFVLEQERSKFSCHKKNKWCHSLGKAALGSHSYRRSLKDIPQMPHDLECLRRKALWVSFKYLTKEKCSKLKLLISYTMG